MSTRIESFLPPGAGRGSRGFSAKLAVLLLVVIGGVAAIWLVSRPERPDESRRVRVAGGLSMVAPRGWSLASDSFVDNTEFCNGMKLEPTNWLGVPPALYVKVYCHPADPAVLRGQGWSVVPFMGQDVLSLKSPALKFITRAIVIERGGQSFQLGLTLPDTAAEPMKSAWWDFLETFQYDATAGAPSSMPAATEYVLPASAP